MLLMSLLLLGFRLPADIILDCKQRFHNLGHLLLCCTHDLRLRTIDVEGLKQWIQGRNNIKICRINGLRMILRQIFD